MKLRNIVGVLSLSTLGSCGLIDKNIGSLENNLTENFYDLSVKERYLLSRDEQRMDALWKFYIESSDEAIIDGDVNENIVLIKT